jgi:hypothetical protein
MSEPAVLMVVAAWLLPPVVVPPLTSLPAPVVTLTAELPTAVGVPLTVQVMTPPMATVAGVAGEHTLVRPAGRPATAQLALVAAAVAVGVVLVQV